MLLSAVVLFAKLAYPRATLFEPVVLSVKVYVPTAVFPFAVVFASNA